MRNLLQLLMDIYVLLEFHESNYKDLFSELKTKYYDDNFEYRLAYSLRKYTTHCSVCISRITYDVKSKIECIQIERIVIVMKNKDLKHYFLIVSISLLVLLCAGAIYLLLPYSYDDYNEEMLLWTRVGAVGGWIGAIFGALALVVSIIAFIVPSIAKIDASLMFGFIGGIDENYFDVMTVTVKNTGMKPVTIKNIYLRFEKFSGTIIIQTMGNGTPIQYIQTNMPQRLDVGEQFNFLIPLDKLIVFLKDQEDIQSSSKVILVVDEVTEGIKQFKTKISKEDIIKPIK